MKSVVCLGLGVVSALSASVHATAVYQTAPATGFFTPFTSSSPAGKKFGEAGYLGLGPAQTLNTIILGLATTGSVTGAPAAAGTTDIVFTFHKGDPSGNFLFGPPDLLYTTTITNVALPAADAGLFESFELAIPLPNIVTDGNFNNIGWTVAVNNFNYSGQFGFQNSGAFNTLGFDTANASEYNPTAGTWSLFAFGPNYPADIANFSATVLIPEPASLSLVAAVAALARRRR